MHSKEEIVKNWLPRYTGTAIEDFGKYILLTNFNNYVEIFAEQHQVEIMGTHRSMPNATANGITLINFGMGSANAATIMDLLTAIEPEACLFLGKCGGLKPLEIMTRTIGQVPFTLQTEEYGSMTRSLNNTCGKCVVWQLIWKQLQFLQPDL